MRDMRALDNADCLNLWERGSGSLPLERGMLALGLALPQASHEGLADWPLGRRNSALTQLHCACFGPSLQGQVHCPSCGEVLEFQMDGQSLLDEHAASHSWLMVVEDDTPADTAAVNVRGRSFRLPTTRDLAIAIGEADPRRAATRLISSCQIEADDAEDWTDEDIEEIGEKMASADPMAEIRLAFICAQCGHQWQENLDIVGFLWMEIEARARRLLMDIHRLAWAYGWTERDILSLSESRRRLYLELVDA
jgi:hypothetical protein